MSDPYKILEIKSNASIEEIKTAYRNLARKYHPDNYMDSPLKDVAESKMKEINEAFDEIMNQRRTAGKESTTREEANKTEENTYNNQRVYTDSSQQYHSSFPDIRNMIQQNRIVEADELLDGIPNNLRDAEWYFLKGSVYYSRGWLDEAANNFTTAVNMDPTNQEYRSTLNRVNWQRQGNTGSPNFGKQGYNGYPGNGCTVCDFCSALICADCCCECMGGDLLCC